MNIARTPEEAWNDLTHLISLGAGVQSSVMAMMAAAGEIEPMPTAAIFADTQAEPPDVYEWLDWLETKLPFPIRRVTAGSLEDEALRIRVSQKGVAYCRTAIPFFTKSGDKLGRIKHRSCTYDYKIRPILKAARTIASVKRGEKSVRVMQWIGISLDEMQRMKPSREPWVECRWPLIEKRMTRFDCLEWMRKRNLPEPPRSACWFCPFRSNAEWRLLKTKNPDYWEKAVQFDRDVRNARVSQENLNSIVYLHRSCMPLDQIDLRTDTDKGQLLLWNDECEGMCGM